MIVKSCIVFILILVNGVFSASEIAFLSLDKLELKSKVKDKNKKAIKIDKMLKNTSSFLATIQIGITLAGFLASAFAADTFVDNLVLYLDFIKISESILKPILVVIVTCILSYFTLVLGELVPKKVAMAYPEKVAYSVVSIIDILMKCTYPFVLLLTSSTNIISKMLGIKDKKSKPITEERIKEIIVNGTDEGAIEEGEKKLIFNIFNFNDVEASQIMTPKENVVSIDVDITKEKLLNIIKKSKFTRMPVYNKEKDYIIGILNIKDIIVDYKKYKRLNILDMMHNPIFVNENDKVDDIFKIMQAKHQAMVIVKDDDDNFVGIITMEDTIEEIVGNIFDEFDD